MYERERQIFEPAPTFWKITLDSAGKFLVLFRVLLSVLGQKRLPLGLRLGASDTNGVVTGVHLIGNVELLLGVEAELLLDVDDVVSLQS